MSTQSPDRTICFADCAKRASSRSTGGIRTKPGRKATRASRTRYATAWRCETAARSTRRAHPRRLPAQFTVPLRESRKVRARPAASSLEVDLHALRADLERQPLRRRMEGDAHAVHVAHRRHAGTAAGRAARRDRGVRAVEVAELLQVVDFPRRLDARRPGADRRETADLEGVLLALVGERAVPPLPPDAGGDLLRFESDRAGRLRCRLPGLGRRAAPREGED